MASKPSMGVELSQPPPARASEPLVECGVLRGLRTSGEAGPGGNAWSRLRRAVLSYEASLRRRLDSRPTSSLGGRRTTSSRRGGACSPLAGNSQGCFRRYRQTRIRWRRRCEGKSRANIDLSNLLRATSTVHASLMGSTESPHWRGFQAPVGWCWRASQARIRWRRRREGKYVSVNRVRWR